MVSREVGLLQTSSRDYVGPFNALWRCHRPKRFCMTSVLMPTRSLFRVPSYFLRFSVCVHWLEESAFESQKAALHSCRL